MSAKGCRPTAVTSQHFHGSPEAGASKPWVPKLSLGTSLESGTYARSQAPLGNAVQEALLPNQEAGAVDGNPLSPWVSATVRNISY